MLKIRINTLISSIAQMSRTNLKEVRSWQGGVGGNSEWRGFGPDPGGPGACSGPEAQTVLASDRGSQQLLEDASPLAIQASSSDFPACAGPSRSVLGSELWSWARDGLPSCRRDPNQNLGTRPSRAGCSHSGLLSCPLPGARGAGPMSYRGCTPRELESETWAGTPLWGPPTYVVLWLLPVLLTPKLPGRHRRNAV